MFAEVLILHSSHIRWINCAELLCATLEPTNILYQL